MKINYDNRNFEKIYKPGNIIKKSNSSLFLITDDGISKYSIVNLTRNSVLATSNSLEGLIVEFAEEGDTLVNAEINVF